MVIETTFRVRYAETDAMGVVYYSNYFIWMEVGRVELLRSAGIDYKDIEAEGLAMPVVEAHCRYRKPAFFDDALTIRTWIADVQPGRLTVHYEIDKKDGNPERIADGYTVHACINSKGRPIRLPKKIREMISEITE